MRWFDGKEEIAVTADCTFSLMNGQSISFRIDQLLLHVFNHQTHHRGQAHACLTMLSAAEPPVLDLLALRMEARS